MSKSEAESATNRAIREEQDFVDQAYAALDNQRDYYTQRLAQVRAQGGHGTPGQRTERDTFAIHYEDNLARLRLVENSLVLGRLDHTNDHNLHIGRITLRAADDHILLTDWRAPQSEPFYQATPAHPGTVVRRRHIQTRLREVTAVEDELLGGAEALENIDTSALNLTGEGALLAAMQTARGGRMGDIVATIQAEQDEIIRSADAGVLVVQGGPGTGKTAVALHRAAYLLYTYRERLAHSGILIVGPSTTFLRYIDQVLPSLGESGVVSTTLAQLIPGITAPAADTAAVAQLKGRIVWQDIARRSVKLLQKPLPAPVSFKIAGKKLTLTPAAVAQAQAQARRSRKPHNQAREIYARQLVEDLAQQLATALHTSTAQDDWIISDVVNSVDARREINLHWLPTSAEQLLARILHYPEVLAQVAPEFSDAERASLRREKGSPLTSSDIAILDEMEELLGPLLTDQERAAQAAAAAEQEQLSEYVSNTMSAMGLGGGIVNAKRLTERLSTEYQSHTLAERAAADRSWTYGHVVVDEAQELTPMQWRMIARRNPARSMTIVGDLDQRPAGAPDGGWAEVLGSLADYHRISELTISYRTPQEVLERAGSVLTQAGYQVRTVTAARSEENSYAAQVVPAAELDAELIALVAAENRKLDEMYGAGLGTLAVIVPQGEAAHLAAVVESASALESWTIDKMGSDMSARIRVTTPTATKGLEYDAVVLVNPGQILHDGPGDLYVALTRCTRALRVLSSAALLPGL
ncbi:MAG: AAA family ATPase [Trueperella sp.]|nr:AAA family ATPase [Trueperella sp.]